MEIQTGRPDLVFPSDRGFIGFVLLDDGTVARRDLEIGLRGRGRVSVITGVKEGEPVVVIGGRGLEDGQPVAVVRGDTKPDPTHEMDDM